MINPVHSTRMPSLWLGRCGPFDSIGTPATAAVATRVLLSHARVLGPRSSSLRTKEMNATLSTPPTSHLFGWGLGASQGNISVEFLETQGGGPAKAG